MLQAIVGALASVVDEIVQQIVKDKVEPPTYDDIVAAINKKLAMEMRLEYEFEEELNK